VTKGALDVEFSLMWTPALKGCIKLFVGASNPRGYRTKRDTYTIIIIILIKIKMILCNKKNHN
jgi:hypothetical protein